MNSETTSMGKASLWTAILGLVVPICLAGLVLVVVLYLTPQRYRGAPKYAGEGLVALGICYLLFCALELVALGCGIAGRHTAAGKAGIAVSGVLLTVALGLLVFFFSS
jgi:hypothetical protein